MSNIDFINTEEYKRWDKKRKAYERRYKISKECSEKWLKLYHTELDINWQNELKDEQQREIDKAKNIPVHSKKTKLLSGIIPLLCYIFLILIACISDSKLFLILCSTIFALMYFLGYYPKLFDNVPVSEYEEKKIKDECRRKKLGLLNNDTNKENNYKSYLAWLKAEIIVSRKKTYSSNSYTVSTRTHTLQDEENMLKAFREDCNGRRENIRNETNKKMERKFKELDEHQKHLAERSAHRDALLRCGRCKYYNSCHSHIVNCGAFTPRF